MDVNTFYPEMMGDYQMYPNKDAYTIIQNNAIVLYDLKLIKSLKNCYQILLLIKLVSL